MDGIEAEQACLAVAGQGNAGRRNSFVGDHDTSAAMLWLWLLLVGLALGVYYAFFLQHHTASGLPVVGGGIPWLGCGVQLASRGPYFLQECHKKHGDMFQLYAGGKRLYFVMHPGFLRLFYTATEAELSFFDGISDESSSFGLARILGNGPKAWSKEEHFERLPLRVLRRFLRDHLPESVENVLEEEMAAILEANMPGKKGSVDVLRLMTHAVVALSIKLMVGPRLARDKQFIDDWFLFQEAALQVINLPPLLSKKQTKQCTETRNRILAKIEEDTRRCLRERTEDEDGDGYLPLAAVMVPERFECSGTEFGVEWSAFTVFSFIFATIANTNATLTDVLLEMVAQPDVMERCREECEAVAGRLSTATLAKECQYLDACLSEALRLYAPPIHIRKAVVDLTAEKVLENGPDPRVIVPKGQFVCLSPFLRHRDPDIYPEPERFLPSRHLAESKNAAKFAFLTFGQGKHYCMGKALAQAEMKLTLVKLLTAFELCPEGEDTFTSTLPQAQRKLAYFTFGVILPANTTRLRYARR